MHVLSSGSPSPPLAIISAQTTDWLLILLDAYATDAGGSPRALKPIFMQQFRNAVCVVTPCIVSCPRPSPTASSGKGVNEQKAIYAGTTGCRQSNNKFFVFGLCLCVASPAAGFISISHDRRMQVQDRHARAGQSFATELAASR
jgi:hypothetical protein